MDDFSHRERILTFTDNRVWRTYPGGKVLDIISGKKDPEDTHFPEDWIGSTTQAINPDREEIIEGIATALWPEGGTVFRELLQNDGQYLLGDEHMKQFGPSPQVLIKYLDSAVRLHFQCHPTADFARKFLDKPAGKAEAYHILAIREEVDDPYIYLGFQRPPSREELKRMIEEQDISAMEGCMDKIPVKPGDTVFIPGGFPHAIGEGILMVEIMEPSDLAVRFEFEKAGYVLPESARFMHRGLEFCLDVFDYSQTPIEEVFSKYIFQPLLRRYYSDKSAQFQLIDGKTTPCFDLRISLVADECIKSESSFYFFIVLEGSVEMKTKKGSQILHKFDRGFVSSGIDSVKIVPHCKQVRLLEIFPPNSGS